MIKLLGQYILHLPRFGGQPQVTTLDQNKKQLLTETALIYLNLTKPIISSDASYFGIGGVLLQEHIMAHKPYTCKQNYAQIEKE